MTRFAPLLATLALLIAPAAPARADETVEKMANAATRLLGAMDDAQKTRASFAFDSPERLNWHWIPRERKGLPIKDLRPDQLPLAFALLNTGLTTDGAIRVSTIMSLEEILRVEEKGTGPIRDSELYFLSFFGTPSAEGTWGWRVEGHHLSLNYTIRDGKLVGITPFMLGSNPALVRSGPRKGLRNLGTIEAPVDELLSSLTPDQLKAALVSTTAPEVTSGPNPPQQPEAAPEGISSEALQPAQREIVDQIIRAYLENFPEPIRSELLAQMTGDPARPVHLAWYGSTDRSKNHAFRLSSPTYFIDFNNTQNDTNHIHTFFRSKLGDFGVPVAK